MKGKAYIETQSWVSGEKYP